jgi:hypothetical protein
VSSLHDPATRRRTARHRAPLAIDLAAQRRPPRHQWMLNHIKEYAPMSRIRVYLTAVVFAAITSTGAVVAQTPESPPATKTSPEASAPDSPKPSTATQVETWTSMQWEAAKEEWARNKAKWADCQEQSSKQKLEGRKSWSFLYTCMTS